MVTNERSVFNKPIRVIDFISVCVTTIKILEASYDYKTSFDYLDRHFDLARAGFRVVYRCGLAMVFQCGVSGLFQNQIDDAGGAVDFVLWCQFYQYISLLHLVLYHRLFQWRRYEEANPATQKNQFPNNINPSCNHQTPSAN